MRQSPRGDRDTEPTLGLSGRQERLNCWVKKRRMNVLSHFTMVSRSYLPLKAFPARNSSFSGEYPKRKKLYRKKSCSSYGPTRSSVFCEILPFLSAGSSSGLTGVSIMSSNMSLASGRESATQRTRCRTSVLGMPAFTPYIDMWSPL